ncbi:MAG: hypothetical protein GXP27_18655 [Planctomycetes bacterium]|nr:hypothetical protein [Planctomycetota bacterium]
MDNYTLLTFLMLALALALFVAEVFIPSGGVIVTAALICLGVSIWCAVKAWWQTDQMVWWWSYILAVVLLIPAVIIGAFSLLPRTEFGRNLLVEPQNPEELKPYVEEEEHLSQLVGKVGKTVTLLNPAGIVVVDGERYHCESEGIIVDRGETVRVLSVKGNRLVVRRVPQEESGEPPASSSPSSPSPDQEQLDFDLPA